MAGEGQREIVSRPLVQVRHKGFITRHESSVSRTTTGIGEEISAAVPQRPIEVKAGMKGTTDLPAHSFRGPASLQGIDFSDHRNYWPHDIPALMVTNTAFYRNDHYHTPRDTADRLDYDRMGKVVVGVYEAIRFLSR